MNSQVTSKVYFSVFAEDNASIEKKIKVFKSENKLFLGEPFSFKIIGWSHFITAPSIGYNELFASMDVTSGSTFTFDMNIDIRKEVASFEIKDYLINTEIWVESYKKEINKKEYDLFYEFPNKAYTGIRILKSSYETIHAYPEFDKNIYTRTIFRSKK